MQYTRHSPSYDCLIIGGGIIGLSTARELNHAGLRVALIEKGQTGRESSWAGGGILSPLYPWRYPASVTRLARWSQAFYPSFAQALAEESGIDPEYTVSGLLIPDTNEKESALDWAVECETPMEVIDEIAVARCEPGLMDPPDSALWLPEVAQIRNPLLLRALGLSLEDRVTLLEHTNVTQILIRGNRAIGVETSRGPMFAGHTILCAGAWSGRLVRGLGHSLPIRPVLGQMILFHGTPGLISRILLHSDRYVIPRRDGRVLAGSTVEDRGFRKETSGQALAELKRFALDRFPVLAEYPVEKHWAGLRPASPAGVPFIGPYPGIEGLYVNSGHFRNGLVTAPASARLLADLLLARPAIVRPQPYALDAPRDDPGNSK